MSTPIQTTASHLGGDAPGAPAVLPDAVLWDMDGTIVDTEPYWIAEEIALIESWGGRWSHEDAVDLVGSDLQVSARIIIERTPVDLPVDEVVDRLITGVIARTQQEMPWRPGALALLEELSALGVPGALVTMSWTSLADVVVAALPAGTFDTVVTGDVVSRGKPDPEPYHVAMERIAASTGAPVRPDRCVAIEDSVTGARSAFASGARTLVVPHVVPVPAEIGHAHWSTLEGATAADLGALLP